MMRCTFCHGVGVKISFPTRIYSNSSGMVTHTEQRPCRECNGTGIVHCCEGEQCQPEVG